MYKFNFEKKRLELINNCQMEFDPSLDNRIIEVFDRSCYPYVCFSFHKKDKKSVFVLKLV